MFKGAKMLALLFMIFLCSGTAGIIFTWFSENACQVTQAWYCSSHPTLIYGWGLAAIFLGACGLYKAWSQTTQGMRHTCIATVFVFGDWTTAAVLYPQPEKTLNQDIAFAVAVIGGLVLIVVWIACIEKATRN